MPHNNDSFRPRKEMLEKRVEDLSQLNGQEIATWAGHIAGALVFKDRLKTHQLRNVYSAIERIRIKFQNSQGAEDLTTKRTAEFLDELFLLLPQLAFAAGRQRAVNYTLFPFLDAAISGVKGAAPDDRPAAFTNFFSLLESVVGFHKYFENNRSGKPYFLTTENEN